MPDTLPTVPLLVNGLAASRLLAISERTLWGITSPRGDLPAVRIGRAVRYAVADLTAYIERLREQARASHTVSVGPEYVELEGGA